MKKPELYKKTVDILLAAHKNNTLNQGSCRSCAVGNLIYANINNTDEWEETDWYRTFIFKVGDISEDRVKRATDQVKSTGYTIPQIIRIERAFENNEILGVIDVLQAIHETTDEETQTTKNLFN